MFAARDLILAAGDGDLEGMREEMAAWDGSRLAARYMQGMCGPFALALCERAGWETVAVFDGPGGLWGDHPRHVGCRAPDGTYADARGFGLEEDAFTCGFRTDGGVTPVVRPMGVDAIRGNYRARTEADWLLATEHLDRILPGLEDAVLERGHGAGPRP